VIEMKKRLTLEYTKDRLLMQLWLVMSDLSYSEENGTALTTEDLDIWVALTNHPSIRKRLDQLK
jgi:hypothetical protein